MTKKVNIIGVTSEEVRAARRAVIRRTNMLKAKSEMSSDQAQDLEVLEEFRKKLSAAVRRLDPQTKETD